MYATGKVFHYFIIKSRDAAIFLWPLHRLHHHKRIMTFSSNPLPLAKTPPHPNDDMEKRTVPAEPHAPKGPLNLAAPESEFYPEGGRAAYLSLFGCFCAWMCAFGLMNTIGTFQAYLGTHQLIGYSEADIGWIFGLYLFMAYCCGVQTGPIFDAIGPRWLTVAGSVCLVLCMFLLETCSRGCYISIFDPA